MPLMRNTAPDAPNYEKRRTFVEGRALVDAAHVATYRLYCDVLALWRRCSRSPCSDTGGASASRPHV